MRRMIHRAFGRNVIRNNKETGTHAHQALGFSRDQALGFLHENCFCHDVKILSFLFSVVQFWVDPRDAFIAWLKCSRLTLD